MLLSLDKQHNVAALILLHAVLVARRTWSCAYSGARHLSRIPWELSSHLGCLLPARRFFGCRFVSWLVIVSKRLDIVRSLGRMIPGDWECCSWLSCFSWSWSVSPSLKISSGPYPAVGHLLNISFSLFESSSFGPVFFLGVSFFWPLSPFRPGVLGLARSQNTEDRNIVKT